MSLFCLWLIGLALAPLVFVVCDICGVEHEKSVKIAQMVFGLCIASPGIAWLVEVFPFLVVLVPFLLVAGVWSKWRQKRRQRLPLKHDGRERWMF